MEADAVHVDGQGAPWSVVPTAPRQPVRRVSPGPSVTRRDSLDRAASEARLLTRAGHADVLPTRRDFDHEPVAVLAHELRAPLATIVASAELLSEYQSLSEAEVEALVRRIRSGASWMNRLVENLDTWAALRDGRLTLQRGPVAVAECINASLALVEPMLERRGQRARVLCPDPSPTVMGDALRLGQVLLNLLSNASHYGVAGDVITVRVAADSTRARISVVNRGPGIEPSQLGRIFEPYHRGVGSHQDAPFGHGLGLYIVRSLVELHGGEVGVESVPDQQTTFWFTVPLA